jgi:hypothetical protein
VQEFLFRANTLHASLDPANHAFRIEAVIRQWSLELALRTDVGKLTNLLIQFSPEAISLSQANTLHGNTLPDHFGSNPPMTEGPIGGDRSGKGGTGRRNHPSECIDLLLTNPDSRRGVRGWGLCDRVCQVLVCRGRYCLGGVFLLFILGSNLGGGGPVRGLRGGGRRGWCEE